MRFIVIFFMCFAASAACNPSSAFDFLKSVGLFLVLVITSLILQYTTSGFRHSCPPLEVRGKARVKVKSKNKKKGESHEDFVSSPERWGDKNDSFFEDLD
jgi:hypothetical protein